jgi:hypothetical protein
MILAYKTGLLVAVTKDHVTPKSVIITDDNGRQITVRNNEPHRKLFDGRSAVDEATKWILKL